MAEKQSSQIKNKERPKVVVDCDAGSDDVFALAMLIAAHKLENIELLAITCVDGNTSVDNVVKNVFRTLHVCDASNIPVFKGANSALLNVNDEYKNIAFHGLDGLGDVFVNKPVDIRALKEEHAVCALHRISNEYHGQVTVICLGPLTNIALTMKMYPQFVNSVDKFLVMGGNNTAVGNTTSQAEFNFYADPESVHIVLSNVKKNLYLLPWETCMRSTITHEWRKTVVGKINNPVNNFLSTIDDAIYDQDKKIKVPFYRPCDAFVSAFFLRPDIAKSIKMYHIDIELNGKRTRGQVVIDHLMMNEPNAYIIEEINYELFKDLMIFTADPNTEKSRELLNW
ncbi:uncharacterized protein LOC106648647 [Trichogramma pretiosum]|uniref:uncharacterized protein LOC106648647 n=1 Tax=Trichogramma pretiosum TaxID=7493 RepID=UPI0006C9BD1E|nr:uncharacterized protein LOC106648647 [Trichogramma pretiosum]XP_014221188.1 uncharacterized protein LOC106648647 [Trichogramma pretiosum]